MSAGVETDVEGRRLTLSNLDKVLYPSGFTKAQVIDYYARIAADHDPAPQRPVPDVSAIPQRL